MKVYDIVTALDAGLITAPFLLDFSAAFDCVDPSILMQVLELKFGVNSFSAQADCFISDWQDALSSCWY